MIRQVLPAIQCLQCRDDSLQTAQEVVGGKFDRDGLGCGADFVGGLRLVRVLHNYSPAFTISGYFPRGKVTFSSSGKQIPQG